LEKDFPADQGGGFTFHLGLEALPWPLRVEQQRVGGVSKASVVGRSSGVAEMLQVDFRFAAAISSRPTWR
jgi:hypothetical protein